MTDFIATLNGQKCEKIPFWFMRQAGRYLPEYMKLRTKMRDSGKTFLDMCYDADLATEITLQPINRFKMPAAIVFSDILTVPNALGLKVEFCDGKGPILEKFSSSDDLKKLSLDCGFEKYNMVGNVVKNVRDNLAKDKALIGFSGCPFTLACYMTQGMGSKDFHETLKMVHKNPDLFDELIHILTHAVVDYLSIQIEKGADCIQLFDSHAGILHGKLYEKYITMPNREIVSKIKAKYPKIPIICFPKGSGILYKNFAENVDCEAISIDNSASNSFFANAISNKVLQGNLDNFLLCYGKTQDIRTETENIIRNFGAKPFIFNLSHGMLKDTPIENVEAVCEILHSCKYNICS
ncbi:uroporphyrinogen decarboxylase [Candidatus Deianiraea vastatrix]|uniref:Uroporphyrinogen decarboxylase n=1 Tax=Candidatus Deianiraea vastatrix TaxID=2163644 RepID=A0A5B8XCJ2_9RICK|nr:uroporphyrinogen decarboxylase [Candidatus Deianiraea vastatrix]QED23058.1 Uroporphyrinogen decarboxylase [Candidatus Deianiraea vastatrix]